MILQGLSQDQLVRAASLASIALPEDLNSSLERLPIEIN